jgi:glycosyltransferase involved in cell wall biosynthesis
MKEPPPYKVICSATNDCTASAILYLSSDTSALEVDCLFDLLALPTFEDFEFVLIDDGLAREAGLRLSPLMNSGRVTCLKFDNALGLPAWGLNLGLLLARGTVVVLGTSMGAWSPDNLSAIYLKRESATITVSNLRHREALKPEYLMLLQPFDESLLVFSKKILTLTGLLDPHLILREFYLWDWLLRASAKGVSLTSASIYQKPHEKSSRVKGVRYAIARHYMSVPRDDRLMEEVIGLSNPLETAILQPSLKSIPEWEAFEKEVFAPFAKAHPAFSYEPLILHNHIADADSPSGLTEYQALLPKRPRVAILGETFNLISQQWAETLALYLNAIVVPYAETTALEIEHDSVDMAIVIGYPSEKILKKLPEIAHFATTIVMIGSDIPLESGQDVLLVARLSDLVLLPETWFQNHSQVNYPQNVLRYQWLVNSKPAGFATTTLPPALRVVLYDLAGEAESIPGAEVVDPSGSLLNLVAALDMAILVVPADYYARLGSENTELIQSVLYDSKSVIIEYSPLVLRQLQEDKVQLLFGELEKVGTHSAMHLNARSLQLANLGLLAEVLRIVRTSRVLPPGEHPDLKCLVFLNSPLLAGSEMYGMLLAHGLSHLGIPCQVIIPTASAYYSNESEKGDSIDAWLLEHHLPIGQRVPYGLEVTAFYKTVDEVGPVVRRFAEWLDKQPASILIASGSISELLYSPRRPDQLLVNCQMQMFGYPTNRLTALVNRATALICDSNWSVRQWARFMPPPIRFVPSSIEAARFRPTPPVSPVGTIKIAIGGTLSPRKRQWECLLAIEMLIAEGFDLEANFYGYELEADRSYIQQLKAHAEHPILKGRVGFHGLVSLDTLIDDNHLFLIGSINESLPQTMLYSMAGGLLCVAAPAGGIGEVVIEGETGYLSEGYTSVQLAQSLRKALQHREDWPQITARAQTLIRERFTEQFAVHQFLLALREGAAIQLSPGRLFSGSFPVTHASFQKNSWNARSPVLVIRTALRQMVDRMPESQRTTLMDFYTRHAKPYLFRVTKGRW